jgi:predicted transcriptional regulator
MKELTFTAISEELTNRIFKSSLTMAQKTLAMYLLTKFNRKSHVVCISIRKMADDLNCSTRTIRLGVNALVKDGFIEVVKHKGKGKNGGDYQHYKLPKVHVTKEGILVKKVPQGVVKSTTESTKSVVKSTTITTSNNNRNETSPSSLKVTKDDVSNNNKEEKQLEGESDMRGSKNNQHSSPSRHEPKEFGKAMKVNRKCTCGSQIMLNIVYLTFFYGKVHNKYLVCAKCGKLHSIVFHGIDDYGNYIPMENNKPLLPRRLTDDGTKYVDPSEQDLLDEYIHLMDNGLDYKLMTDRIYENVDDECIPWNRRSYNVPKFTILDKDVAEDEINALKDNVIEMVV